MHNDHVRGFTLIEVMVVVAIIAILAAIAMPIYSGYVLRSKIHVAQADLLALSSNVENYRQRTLAYPASAATAEKGWVAGSKASNFTFTYTAGAGNASYTIKAVGQAAMGKANGCTLTLKADNTRAINDKCAGVSDWP